MNARTGRTPASTPTGTPTRAPGRTGIEWTQATWNPVTGCDQVSPGCGRPRPGDPDGAGHGTCYALAMAARLKAVGEPGYQADGDPATSGPGFGVTVHPARLDRPLRWRRPTMVFVNSMSDLAHPAVPDAFVARVFATMAVTPWHTYQVLTKRPRRLRALLDPGTDRGAAFLAAVSRAAFALDPHTAAWVFPPGGPGGRLAGWPLGNVWLGVSVETDEYAWRAGVLAATPAAVRFVSAEPLLGPLPGLGVDRLDWLIVGGESGPGARPMHPAWARDLRDRAVAAGVALFFKQWGVWAPVPVPGGVADPVVLAGVTRADLASGRVAPVGLDGLPGRLPDGLPGGPGAAWMRRHPSKRAAGRELDGRRWTQYPPGVSTEAGSGVAGRG